MVGVHSAVMLVESENEFAKVVAEAAEFTKPPALQDFAQERGSFEYVVTVFIELSYAQVAMVVNVDINDELPDALATYNPL